MNSLKGALTGHDMREYEAQILTENGIEEGTFMIFFKGDYPKIGETREIKTLNRWNEDILLEGELRSFNLIRGRKQ